MSTETEYKSYFRQLSREPSPLPPHESIEQCYEALKNELPETDLPDGYAISNSRVKQRDIIHFPHTGSLISAASGDTSTSVADVHQLLSLGFDCYETPADNSGLKPDLKIPLIHHKKMYIDRELRHRIIRNAMGFYVREMKLRPTIQMIRYLEEDCPIGLLWLTTAVTDGITRFDNLTQGKILDEAGKINEHLQNSIVLINADSGAGEIQAHETRSKGKLHPFTVTNLLVNESTGFIGRMFGIKKTNTEVGACAASGKAIELAEITAESKKKNIKMAIVMSMYDAPTEGTRESFEATGIPGGDKPPYLYHKDRGYTESPAAVSNIFVSKQFAEQLRLPVHRGRLIRTASYQGVNVFGVDNQIPEKTYEEGFKILQQYYPTNYDGTIVFATHGVNTEGWVVELQALRKLKEKYYPKAHFVITSTQSQMGHSYSTRSSISLEMLIQSIEEGVLPGIVRAKEDMTFVGQEQLQQLRRKQIEVLTGTPVEVDPWTFGGENEKEEDKNRRRAERLLKELESQNIHLCFATMKIPKTVPLVTVHTGLNAESSFTCAIPIQKRGFKELVPRLVQGLRRFGTLQGER